jgi:hypothetical protein
MRIQHWLACFLLLSLSALCETTRSMVPQMVEFPSGKVRLKAYLWKPAGPGPFPAVSFSHGSGGNAADITAGMQITESADILAPFFIKHGYVFLYPFRRGHGPSADQAPFMQDVLRREEKEKRERRSPTPTVQAADNRSARRRNGSTSLMSLKCLCIIYRFDGFGLSDPSSVDLSQDGFARGLPNITFRVQVPFCQVILNGGDQFRDTVETAIPDSVLG